MPAKDFYHDQVRNALVKDGWTITHDPYTLTFGLKDVFVDFGAEKLFAAEKAGKKIAVETKSFLGKSDIHDLEVALGQFVFYRSLLSRSDPDRVLFLAIPITALHTTMSEPIAQPPLQDLDVKLLAFDPAKEEIVKWIK